MKIHIKQKVFIHILYAHLHHTAGISIKSAIKPALLVICGWVIFKTADDASRRDETQDGRKDICCKLWQFYDVFSFAKIEVRYSLVWNGPTDRNTL
jgi:hypothetical protein